MSHTMVMHGTQGHGVTPLYSWGHPNWSCKRIVVWRVEAASDKQIDGKVVNGFSPLAVILLPKFSRRPQGNVQQRKRSRMQMLGF